MNLIKNHKIKKIMTIQETKILSNKDLITTKIMRVFKKKKCEK